MQFIPIKTAFENVFSGDIKIIKNETIQTINYCKMLLSEMEKSKNFPDKKKLFFEYYFITTYYSKLINILKITNTNEKYDNFINETDKLIENFISDYFSKKETFQTIIEIKKNLDKMKHDEIYFFNNLIDKLKNYTKTNNKIKTSMNNIIDEINAKIDSENNSSLLEKLICYRKEQATLFGFKNYFSFAKRHEILNQNEIATLITDLNNKLDKSSSEEIKKTNNNNNIFNIFFNNLDLDLCIENLFKYIEEFYNIKIIKNTNSFLNSEKYVIYYKENILGNLFLNLFNENNKVSKPICIHINHSYRDIDSNFHNKNIAIFANFKKNKFYHYELILFAREIGTALLFLFCDSTIGNITFRDNFYLINSKILENICWEKDFLKKIVNNNEEINKIISMRFFNFATQTKLKFVNIFFDHIIHSSDEIIEELNKYKKYDGSVLLMLYSKLFDNIFSKQLKLFKKHNRENEINEIKKINKNIFLQEINGNECSFYELLIIDIISTEIYKLLKNNGNIEKYLKIIIQAGTQKFKLLLNKFVGNINNVNYLDFVLNYGKKEGEIIIDNKSNIVF